MNWSKKLIVNWIQFLIIASFVLVLGFIIYITRFNLTEGVVVYFEAFPAALLPLIGGISALIRIKRKNLQNSTLGLTVVFFSLGLISWGVATIVWGIYNFFLNIAVPYPSLSDIGYVLTAIFWFIGILFLPRITGSKYKLRTLWGKAVAIFFSSSVILFTFYIVFFKFYGGVFSFEENFLKLVLSIFYPISDILFLAPTLIITVLSWKTLGGTLRKPILLILGSFIFMYLSDMAYALTTSNGTFHNGNWVDLLYMITMLLLGLGVNMLILPITQRKNILFPLQYEDIFSQLALKIIQEEEKIIGSKAWELASEVKGLYVDEVRTLRIQGNKNEVINQLIAQYEQVFGQTSRELAKDTIKGLSTVANTLAIDAMVTLNVSTAIFFIRQASTGNFQSIFPFEAPKAQIERHHPLIYYFLNHKDLILKSVVPELMQRAHTIAEANDLKEIDLELSKHKAELAGGVYSDQELIGVLLLGPKADGAFNQQDLAYVSRLLSGSSGELAQIVHYRDSQAAVLRMRGVQG